MDRKQFDMLAGHFVGEHDDNLKDGCQGCEFEKENMLRGKPERKPYDEMLKYHSMGLHGALEDGCPACEDRADRIRKGIRKEGPPDPVVNTGNENRFPADHEYIAVYAHDLIELAFTLSKVSKDGFEPVGNPLFRDYDMDRRRYEILIRRPLK